MILRTLYQEKINYLLGKPLIKVITGQRRCGKSVLLKQLYEKFNAQDSIYLDIENIDTLLELRHEGFAPYLLRQISQDTKLLAIDEIQKIPGREEVIVGLYNKYPALEIRITGSNSTMLSSDLTTLLRGRYAELHVYPFGYEEFCLYFELPKNSESFMNYISYGGFPSLYIHQGNLTQFQEHTRLLIDSIFIRDIAERYEIQDMNLLRMLFLYLTNTIGGLFSYTAFTHRYSILQKSSYATVMQYLSYMEQSFLLYGLDVYDLQGCTIIQRQKKYYLSDHSRRKVLFSQFDLGAGKELENIFFMEALRQGRKVYVGKIKEKEIDFILEKGTKKIYIQVCYILANNEVATREFSALEAISDSFPKYVISLDPILHHNAKGIQHIQFRNMAEIFRANAY